VRELVIVQAAGQLGLLEVGSDVLVWHLLHAGLEEVVLLRSGLVLVCLQWRCGGHYLFFRPRPVSSGGHLPSTKAGGVGGLRVHLREGRKDLRLVVEHDVR
jgi:hypothetical protein